MSVIAPAAQQVERPPLKPAADVAKLRVAAMHQHLAPAAGGGSFPKAGGALPRVAGARDAGGCWAHVCKQ